MPGYTNGDLLYAGSAPINIQAVQMGRDRRMDTRGTRATAGMCVKIHTTPPGGVGYIVGALPTGELVVWSDREHVNMTFRPQSLEQDSSRRDIDWWYANQERIKGKKRRGSLLSLIRTIRAQIDPLKPVAPGMAPPVDPHQPPVVVQDSRGKQIKPGDEIQMNKAKDDPKARGTVTQIDQNKGITYTDTTGEPRSVAPGDSINTEIAQSAPGSTNTSGVPVSQ